MNVKALRLEGGEAVGDRQGLLAHGGQVLQSLPHSEIGHIIGGISLRKNVENFSYCFTKACLQ
jgi:hypothetical protein